jgi:pilus assembly protein CpaE
LKVRARPQAEGRAEGPGGKIPRKKGRKGMSSLAALQPEPAPILACTISRDVSNFDLLIEDMETELGESWGDLTFSDAMLFLNQPDAQSLEFVAIAVDNHDESDLARISGIITTAKERGIKVILIADEVSPIALHQLLKLGADPPSRPRATATG